MKYLSILLIIILFSVPITAQNVAGAAARLSAKNFDLNGLYSYEGLVGKIGVGKFSHEIAHRLKAVGFKKIIVTVRRQDSLLESVYKQYVQQGGVMKSSDFFQDSELFCKDYFDFFSLINLYVKLFGKENVLVVPQEKLLSDTEETVLQITDFCGTSFSKSISKSKLNKSLSKRSINILRVLNHFTWNRYKKSCLLGKRFTTWKCREVLKRIDFLFDRESKILSEQRKITFFNKFKKSNQQLSDIVGDFL